jgi:hypothetical protein
VLCTRLPFKLLSEFSGRVLNDGDDRAFFEQFASTPEATQLVDKREFLKLKIDLHPGGLTALYDAALGLR